MGSKKAYLINACTWPALLDTSRTLLRIALHCILWTPNQVCCITRNVAQLTNSQNCYSVNPQQPATGWHAYVMPPYCAEQQHAPRLVIHHNEPAHSSCTTPKLETAHRFCIAPYRSNSLHHTHTCTHAHTHDGQHCS